MSQLKYLVVGTGRCGTVFYARLLTSVGISCGHERIFTNQGITLDNINNSKAAVWSGMDLVHNTYVAESSYMSAPYLDHPMLDKTTVVHIVRKPLDVISSFVFGLKYFKWMKDINCPYQRFIVQHIPQIVQYKNPIDRAAYYYLKWNEMIESHAVRLNERYIFFCVEFSSKLFLEKIGINTNDYFHNRKCNSVNPPRKIVYNDISDISLRNSIKDIKDRYYSKFDIL